MIHESVTIGKRFLAKHGSSIGGIPTGYKDYNKLYGLDIDDDVEIGQSSVVMLGTVRPTRLGNKVTVGCLCCIGHDDDIKDNVYIASGSILGGFVTVGKNAFLGLGVVVRNRKRIGDGSFIGMGSNVVSDIPSNVIALGNPCKVIETRRKYVSYMLRKYLT